MPVIVQGRPGAMEAAGAAVRAAGARDLTRLDVVDGWAARLTPAQVREVAASDAVVSVTADRKARFAEYTFDATTTASNYPKTAGATDAWAQGRYGDGVGVAIIDTGVSPMNDLKDRLVYGPDLSGEGRIFDSFGHGTVMAGIIGGNGADSASQSGGSYRGVAPGASLIAIKVAGRNGAVDVSTILRAMHWVSAYRDQYNIRVLNLSWGTTSTQAPTADPLNYAVERLWKQGIVVVSAAGNSGPSAGTILKPADDPVIITAGAYDDKQNLDPSDDSIPSWSSRGPTAAGLNKPDLVVPGRTLIATRSFGSQVESDNPKALIAPSYIKGSGTSEAAAVASGLAALLLQAHPDWTPDQIKYALMSTASPISGAQAGSQGAGRASYRAAVAANVLTAPVQTIRATGLGSLESSRGGRNIQTDCRGDGTIVVIKGEITDHCETWDPAAWTGGAWTGGAWTGGAWTGGAWTGGAWTGGAWTGGAWTGGAWTGGAWTGGAWTGGAWTGGAWTGGAWTGGAWTAGAWTTAEYGDEFLNAFWGNRPSHWQRVAGEVSEAVPPGLAKVK